MADKLGIWLKSLGATLLLPCLPLVIEILKNGHADKGNVVITSSVLSATFIFTAGHSLPQFFYSIFFVITLLLDTVTGTLAEQLVRDYSGTLLASVALLHASERFRWHMVLDQPFP
jgi:hypothetical protein